MDPRSAAGGRGWTRIPRARGDGPPPPRHGTCRPGDSPRSRGWTRNRGSRCRDLRGFPALAGMDPRAAQARARETWIPRARGDGPAPSAATRPVTMDSPRSRGWTPEISAAPDHADGFPALAGMDPGARRRSCAGAWIPRARGDGPARSHRPAHASTDSPRSRGWTPDSGRGAGERGGFPALAGMDLVLHGSQNVKVGIPRARGDGPYVQSASPIVDEDSPRSRGWTLMFVPTGPVTRGFPALAGMDRACARGCA